MELTSLFLSTDVGENKMKRENLKLAFPYSKNPTQQIYQIIASRMTQNKQRNGNNRPYEKQMTEKKILVNMNQSWKGKYLLLLIERNSETCKN